MKSLLKQLLSSLIQKLGYLLTLGTIVICLLEVCYRYQVVDFYKGWLEGLNQSQLNSSKPTILVFGDSFTGHFKSYVKSLREEFPEQNIINTAISGTGIRQHNLIVKNRIEAYPPQHVIYQFYVGNDFTDIKHPINFKTNSIARNTYWFLANHLISIPYLNSRLALFNKTNADSIALQNNAFSPLAYNKRVKTNFKAEPSHLENTILLKGDQKQIYQKWKSYFQKFLSEIPEGVPVTFVLIPHCAQVNAQYQNQMRLIGASFQNPLQDVEYPLIQQIRKDFPQLIIINPLPYFQQVEKNGTQVFYNNDPHLTLESQALLGKYLTSQFAEYSLIKPSE